MTTADEDRTNRAGYYENDMVTIDAGSAVTFYMGSGTDTSSTRYLNLPGGVSYGIEVIPTVACSITSINGRTLKAPMTIGTGGFVTSNVKITRLTVQAGAATDVSVGGKC